MYFSIFFFSKSLIVGSDKSDEKIMLVSTFNFVLFQIKVFGKKKQITHASNVFVLLFYAIKNHQANK